MSKHEYDLSFVDNIPPIEPSLQLGRGADTSWPVNNSTFRDYVGDVRLPDHYPDGLEDIIEEALLAGDHNVGLDIAGGSQAVALRDLIDRGLLDKGLVTNLEDLRSPDTKADTRIDHIAGDLALRQTWDGIIQWKTSNAPDGLALILYRPYGGLQGFPAHVYDRAAHTLLDMVRPGGMFFAQVPESLHSPKDRLLAAYRGLVKRPDVREIIPSTQPVEEGEPTYSLIIKNS